MSDPINPIEFLKEEMENDEIAVRVNAIHRLKTVVTLIGGEQFKNQLLPYLESLIKKEDDEVLFAIADELGNISNLLFGGYTILIPALETLASVEETVVRDAAVKSFQTLSALMSDSDLQNAYIPMILRLASGEWFTSRVSAVNLMYAIYPRAGPIKEKIRQKFIELCNEETPMVRRAIASKIGEFATFVEKDIVINELIPIFKQLSTDEQDSVKVLALESLKSIAKILNASENKTHALPIIIAATEDKSWKIRLALAKNFAQLAEAFGKEITDISLIQIFTNLLKDSETDVRIAGVQSLNSFIKLINVDKLQLLIPQVQALARDHSNSVKTGICEVVGGMVSLVGKDISMQKLFPYLLELVEDKDPDVKINAIKSFVRFAEVVGADLMNPLVPHLKNLIDDKKWRVRISAYETISELALFYQNYDLFIKIMEPIFMGFLKDRAHTIREFGVKKLPSLIQVYKTEWVYNGLLPKLNDALNKDNGYLFRITAIYCLQAVAQSVSQEIANDKILPILLKTGKDSVPNVKFTVIKLLKGLNTKSEIINMQIKPYFQELTNDPDRDVAYFATDALNSL
jgi:serine/threonine-protein phosphatase 2A regulatory subunit A